MQLGKLFDAYDLQARLQPALFTLFPAFVTVAVWFPALYAFGTGLLGLAVASGVTFVFAELARSYGRKAEGRLYLSWGGKPTTAWLRHQNENLDKHTKRRYHAFLEKRVRGWRAPSERDEISSPKDADLLYDTAVKWLLEFARDRKRFPLVFKENVHYGFRRNLYGLRVFGLIVALSCVLANLLALIHHFRGVDSVDLAGAVSLVISLFASAAWLLLIDEAWVRDAGDAYARALLSCCEGSGTESSRTAKQPRRQPT